MSFFVQVVYLILIMLLQNNSFIAYLLRYSILMNWSIKTPISQVVLYYSTSESLENS
jgi:hypothetical protein